MSSGFEAILNVLLNSIGGSRLSKIDSLSVTSNFV